MTMTTTSTFKINPDGSKSDHAKTEHDRLPLPKGQTVQQLTNGQLASLLIEAGVIGVTADNGRSTNLAAYEQHLLKIRKDAGDRAVAEWVRSKS